jgi:predicted molibdopterin-dependent oxidoreductase YjgC
MIPKLTTCTFCGTGCGIYLETVGNRIVGAYPSMSHPANKGKICLRGWHVHEVASSPDRVTSPLLRKNGRFEKASWGEALDFIATRLKKIRGQYGPESVAFLDSPRCSNEEAYLTQKLARAIIGTNNVDHGAGVYCNNSINVLLDMTGVAAASNSIGELARSGVIIVDGVDLGRQLPTIGGWVIRAKLNGSRLIVVDSRRHRVAENADIFLQIKPGTESLLYGALAKVIVDRGLMNLPFVKARCEGCEAFLARVRDYDLLQAAEGCGVPAELIEAAALAYGRARSAAILYSTGVEARDEDSIRGIINLALLTGNFGKEGAGVFPLTEHNNLQGVCDMGMLPDRLPGYQAVKNPKARAALEGLWGAKVPETPGVGAETLFAGGGHTPLKALWLGRYDPVSTAFFGDAVEALDRCELVVVQHLFMTEATRFANVVLPTTAFGEERVSFTSTERRIQIAERVIDPPEGPMPAWEQLTRLARSLGSNWNYESSADVMREIGEVIPFYSGASHENLTRDYGRQWPCTTDRPLGTALLFAGDEMDRPFKFVPVARPPKLAGNPDGFPFTLVFGHSLYYWHQNVLIRHSETLKREYRLLLLDYPDGFVEINSDDAKRLGIRDGDRIRLSTAGGSLSSAARVTSEVRSGTAFVPYFVRQMKREMLGANGDGASLVAVRVEKEGP